MWDLFSLISFHWMKAISMLEEDSNDEPEKSTDTCERRQFLSSGREAQKKNSSMNSLAAALCTSKLLLRHIRWGTLFGSDNFFVLGSIHTGWFSTHALHRTSFSTKPEATAMWTHFAKIVCLFGSNLNKFSIFLACRLRAEFVSLRRLAWVKETFVFPFRLNGHGRKQLKSISLGRRWK